MSFKCLDIDTLLDQYAFQPSPLWYRVLEPPRITRDAKGRADPKERQVVVDVQREVVHGSADRL